MSDQTSGFAPGWPSNSGEAVEVAPSAELQLTEEQKDALIQRWLGDKQNAQTMAELEKDSRASVTAALFPTPKKGTQRYVSPKGLSLIHI